MCTDRPNVGQVDGSDANIGQDEPSDKPSDRHGVSEPNGAEMSDNHSETVATDGAGAKCELPDSCDDAEISNDEGEISPDDDGAELSSDDDGEIPPDAASGQGAAPALSGTAKTAQKFDRFAVQTRPSDREAHVFAPLSNRKRRQRYLADLLGEGITVSACHGKSTARSSDAD